MSIPVLRGKRRGPAPSGQTPVTAIRLSPDLRAACDRAIAAQPEPCSRSEFIRRILTEALSAKGYLAEPDKPERAD